jgi:hypothetical protein
MAENLNPNQPAPQVDYDRHEARAGLIALISASIIGLLVVLIVGVYWLYMVSYEYVERQQYTGVPSMELKAIHDREEEHLHQYSYIDKEKGLVRIPISRAMELLANDIQAGKVPYNTTTYDVKVEAPGGAGNDAAPAAAAPATSDTNNATAAR